MTPGVLAGLVIVVSVLAWGGFLAYVTLMRSRTAEVVEAIPVPEEKEMVGARAVAGAPAYVLEAEPAVRIPRAKRPEEDVAGVSRRQFLNRGILTMFIVTLGQFALASLDFFYPRLRGGLGTKLTVGNADEIRARLAERNGTQSYFAEGRFYLMAFEGDPDRASRVPAYQRANTLETGIVALYRKCVHLGCSVPWCKSAKWFECPCHGSKYSVNGEYRDGPAPRGLDRFRVEVVGGQVVVDTSSVITGPPRGTNTAQPQPEGEHCVEIGGE